MTPVPDVSDRALRELVSLEGRTAVVTGGARGLGRAIAARLAEAGATVVVGDIDDLGASATADDVSRTFGVEAVATHLDVADPASIARAAEAVVDARGSIDIWVNNAGVFGSTPTLDLADDAWQRAVQVNLTGTFVGCREAARQMVRGGRGGVIINLSSVAGLRGRGPGIPHYAATKHGIIGITRQLAVEFAEAGIRVLALAPTTIATPGVRANLGDADLEEALTRPLGRAGQPDDVARVALFCASDLSMFMSGTCLVVDGGELAR